MHFKELSSMSEVNDSTLCTLGTGNQYSLTVVGVASSLQSVDSAVPPLLFSVVTAPLSPERPTPENEKSSITNMYMKIIIHKVHAHQ